VIEDEVGHEAAAAAELREVLETTPGARRRAEVAAQKMILHMLWSGRQSALPMGAFLRLGKPAELLAAILGGHVRRMRAVGLAPFGLPLPGVLVGGGR
jgi:hypothetical protein